MRVLPKYFPAKVIAIYEDKFNYRLYLVKRDVSDDRILIILLNQQYIIILCIFSRLYLRE